MIVFQNLNKSVSESLFRKKIILKNVSANISTDNVTFLVGGNGAGKTTLIKILLGFSHFSSGSLCCDSHLRSQMGYLPERPILYKNFTGLEYIHYLKKISSKKGLDESEILNLAQRLSILEDLNKPLKAYSKGMIQKISLMGAMMGRPQFLVMDEPFSGLDTHSRNVFKKIFLELKEEKRGIFLSTHLFDEVEEIADDLMIMNKGELIFFDKIDQFPKNHKKAIIHYKENNHYYSKCVNYEDKERSLTQIINQGGIILNLTTQFIDINKANNVETI